MGEIEDYDPFAESEPEPEEKPVEVRGLLKAGARFGNFQVVKCISAGLIANYYLMQHVRDLHDVTVCIFHDRVKSDPRCLKRLQGLQRTLSSFNHSGIPKIRDCLEIEDSYCLCLDAVEGVTLSQFFADNKSVEEGKLGLDDASRIIALLHGLIGYAHAQGVDHRDLDTDLIFIRPDGSINVLGLGIKATLGPAVFESIVSASVSPIGDNRTAGRLNSFDVMSPEYRGGIDEDSRVDIYTIGVIAYWLLTGLKIEQKDLELPPAAMVQLPVEWNQFLKNSIERNRDLRYQSSKIALLGLKQVEGEEDSERAGLIQRQIDSIPVPKGILARGPFAARVYRLCLIGVVGVTLVALMAYVMTSTLGEDPSARKVAEGEVVLSVNDTTSANLLLSIEPTDAKVELRAHSKSFVAKDGTLALELVPGDYTLNVTAPLFTDQRRRVSVVDSDSPVNLTVKLEQAWTDLEVRSVPEASVSFINLEDKEVELGITNEEGVLILSKAMLAGTFDFMVRRPGHETTTIEGFEVLIDKSNVLEAPLVAEPAGLSVTSFPEGATVSIDGGKVGVTPFSLENIDIKERHVVDVQLEGYRSRRRSVKIEPGETMIVEFGDLDRQIGSFEIKPSFKGVPDSEIAQLAESLKVKVDGDTYDLNHPYLTHVPAGVHTLGFVHPVYWSDPLTVRLKDRETKVVPVLLSPLPSRVRFVFPPDLEVSVYANGVAMEVVDEIVKLPAKREIEVQVQIKDHLTMVKKFDLKPTEESLWEINPVKIPGPKEGRQWMVPYLGIELEWVEPGAFQMGSPPVELGRLPNEGPLTDVRFTRGFWSGSMEVTQQQYSSLMKSNPSEFVSSRKPVESVTWQAAKLFCERLTEIERAAGRLPDGYVYRLPTEAEWEFAARGGTTTAFYFGETADPSRGNFRGVYPRGFESDARVPDFYGTAVVGSYGVNGFGLSDVHGNVKEWTVDKYNGRLRGGVLTDPVMFEKGNRVAVRGGSWEDYAVRVRTACRDEVSPKTISNAIGFRVFLTSEF